MKEVFRNLINPNLSESNNYEEEEMRTSKHGLLLSSNRVRIKGQRI